MKPRFFYKWDDVKTELDSVYLEEGRYGPGWYSSANPETMEWFRKLAEEEYIRNNPPGILQKIRNWF